MPDEKINRFRAKLHKRANALGSLFVDIFHYLALFSIGIVIAVAAFFAFVHMFKDSDYSVEHILLLFIYLELGAMVGIYFKTNRLPVRYLIYIAITALTRLMIGDISLHDPNMNTEERILLESIAILLLSIAVLVIRYASSKFPVKDDIQEKVG